MLFSRSRQLHTAGFVCALALAGCGSGHSSGGPGSGLFIWASYDMEDTQYSMPLTCAEVGGGNVVLTLTNQATGVAYPQAPAGCAAGQIITTDVPAGAYTLRFELYGDPIIYGNTTPLLDFFDTVETFHIAGGMTDFSRQTYAPFQIRSFVLGWDIYYRSVVSTCASVGASYVDLDFTATGSSTVVTSRFSCASGDRGSGGAGVGSFAIPYDATSATWQLYLLNASGQELQMIDGGAAVGIPAAGDVNLNYQVFSL
jgi:hypothetical protein